MTTENKNNIFNKFKDYATKMGGKCLETSYLGYDVKHRFSCKDNHEFSFDGREFIRRESNNGFCVYCDGKKVDYEYIVSLLEKINFNPVSTEYVDSDKTKFTIICNVCNTEASSVWDNLKQRQVKNGCHICNKSNKKIEEINQNLEKIGYKFISKLYINNSTKYDFSCMNDHILNTSVKTMLERSNKNYRCKKC